MSVATDTTSPRRSIGTFRGLRFTAEEPLTDGNIPLGVHAFCGVPPQNVCCERCLVPRQAAGPAYRSNTGCASAKKEYKPKNMPCWGALYHRHCEQYRTFNVTVCKNYSTVSGIMNLSVPAEYCLFIMNMYRTSSWLFYMSIYIFLILEISSPVYGICTYYVNKLTNYEGVRWYSHLIILMNVLSCTP